MKLNRISIALTLALLGVIMLESRSVSASDSGGGLPAGWVKSGSHPQNYEMAIDMTVKRGGRAGAHIKFTGEKAEGFGTLMQSFKADDYLARRVRMSAWVKTEGVDAAHLFLRLDGERATLGFDNMDNRVIRGTTGWQKYDITLDVPAETINVAFGVFVSGRGKAWVDDFRFETVGADVAATDMLTPVMKQEQSPYKASSAGVPARPVNLDFEAGAYPERKVAKVDPKIYDAYTGQYQSADGPVVTLTREGDRLIQQLPGGVKNEWLPLSTTEFFSSNNPQGSAVFVTNAQGQVTHYVRRRGGQEIILKKIK